MVTHNCVNNLKIALFYPRRVLPLQVETILNFNDWPRGNSAFILHIVLVSDQIFSHGIVALLVRYALPVIVEAHRGPSVPLSDTPSVFFCVAAKKM